MARPRAAPLQPGRRADAAQTAAQTSSDTTASSRWVQTTPSNPSPAAAAGLGLLGVVCTHRLDAVVSLLVCAAVWAASARRPGWSGAALGLAIATKLVPALLAPLLLAYAMADAVDR